MTEIDQRKNVATNPVSSGLAVVKIETRFHKNMTPNTAKHSGYASLAFKSANFDTRIIGPVLEKSGQSAGELIGEIEQAVPVNLENSLQQFPDGTFVHISEEMNTELLNQAPKSVVVQNSNKALTRRENMKRLIMHVFSTSDDPGNYGLQDWFVKKPETQQEETDNLIKFPERKELKPVA